MKIEKLNENQIRCTLTRADLAARHLKLSELAYGTEKAKSLFRDMMQQASFDFGFEAEDIPLMIEAIPVSSDSIVLIITKVEDPEELDTRFSNSLQVATRSTDCPNRLTNWKVPKVFSTCSTRSRKPRLMSRGNIGNPIHWVSSSFPLTASTASYKRPG